MKNVNIYHVAINGDFEECDYEALGTILEIQACSLEQALECFVKHFDPVEDVLECKAQKTGTMVVYTRSRSWEFAQRFGCPHVWGLVQVSEWEPEYENEFGETCCGFTQEEYDSFLENCGAESALHWQVNAYLDR